MTFKSFPHNVYVRVPYRDYPLAVAAKVQIGYAGGPQPQRGVEFGASAEVPNLPRETSEQSESKNQDLLAHLPEF